MKKMHSMVSNNMDNTFTMYVDVGALSIRCGFMDRGSDGKLWSLRFGS